MDTAIRLALQTVEKERDIRILYACEAGSRAWGIQSEDSDYDVRFIYVRSQEAYLRLDTPRDVIELPIKNYLDMNGWDIYKALRLLRKSNPTLLEWLFSPIVYSETSPAITDMRNIASSLISPKTSIFYHYLHMANGNYCQYIKEKSPVLLKKYLYVIRPLVMLLCLEKHGSFPLTVNFPSILTSVGISDETMSHINDIIARKQSGDELGMSPPDTALNNFIEDSLEHWKNQTFSDQHNRHAMQQATARILQNVLSEKIFTVDQMAQCLIRATSIFQSIVEKIDCGMDDLASMLNGEDI